jgi:ABC-2 type transport system permease protein
LSVRTLRLIALFWRLSVESELEYRLNFVVTLLSSVLGLAFGVVGVSLFFQGDTSFPGWTFEQSLIVLGVFTMLQGYVACLLSPNLSSIVTHVESGSLDYVLLKPVDSQLWVSVRQLSPWGIPDVLFGAGLVAFGAQRSGATVVDVALATAPFAAGLLLLYSIWFLVASMSIWFVRVYNATEVLRGLLDAGRFPVAAYPVLWRGFFTYFVPIAFLTTVPAEVLLGRRGVGSIALALVIACVAFVLSRLVWRRALRSYTSASS